MKPDIDRPSTWKKYYTGLCENCWSGCCVMPVEIKLEDLIQLGIVTEDEASGSINKITKRLIKEGIVKNYRNHNQMFMLSQKNGSDCVFLDSKTRLCTVYEKRPEVCRQFPNIGPRPGFCPGFKK